jgi:hypothetical protein
MSSMTASDRSRRETRSLTQYNEFLESNVSLVRLNEGFLDRSLKQLEKHSKKNTALYWLTYARLNELTLYCAGNYADNFEFSAAGDLLVNPRRILVHFRNQGGAVVKDRHRNLTDQFGDASGNRRDVVRWLKRETVLETQEKPLLPFFLENLRESDRMTDRYLDSVENRMKKIADAIGFFGCLNFVDSHEFYLRLQNTPEEEKAFIRSKQCLFDGKTFDALGSDFYSLIRNGDYRSGFLKMH